LINEFIVLHKFARKSFAKMGFDYVIKLRGKIIIFLINLHVHIKTLENGDGRLFYVKIIGRVGPDFLSKLLTINSSQ
jgi:hypothetical protein